MMMWVWELMSPKSECRDVKRTCGCGRLPTTFETIIVMIQWNRRNGGVHIYRPKKSDCVLGSLAVNMLASKIHKMIYRPIFCNL